jgi:inorganic phosphate transporter, PiT family
LQSKDREMSFTLSVALAVGVLIAYANGSNHVSMGIATLVGCGVTDYRRAILWGTVWTGLGGLVGSLLAGAMIGTFAKGFLANLVTASLVGPGAALGLPMSTTHVSAGAIVAVAAQRSSETKWKTVREMLLAWVVTLPRGCIAGYSVLLATSRPGVR